MKQKVFIRTDGSAEIGLGHLVRCISLAHMLKEHFAIHFFAMKILDSFISEITQNEWDVTVIKKEADFLNKLSEDEIVVLDGYEFDTDYQKQIKSKGCKLVCIDDFHNQYFYADLVINHAPGLVKDDYEGESYTNYLLGPDYALLRPEFLEPREPEQRISAKRISKIFICFGGSDYKNLTAKILSWLPSKDYLITVVLGNAYTHEVELNIVIKERQDLKIVVKKSLDAKDLRNELEQADLAIVPASGISVEALVVGVPSIIGYYSSNQNGIYDGLVNKKGFYDAADFSRDIFINAFETANENYQLPEFKSPSGISKNLNNEFIKIRSQVNLKLREATENDIDYLFEWANDSITRENSYDQKKINYTSHINWVHNKLNSSDCMFLIFEDASKHKIGFVRFDKSEQESWVISINIAPPERGKGYSVELLRRAVSYFTSIRGEEIIKAYIKKVNTASIRAFERAGFELQKELNIKGEESILMIWK
jgi:UDP-2,4-diacetamido-2,4,6-trideoxy-beta-L-altropyranose hydrolase